MRCVAVMPQRVDGHHELAERWHLHSEVRVLPKHLSDLHAVLVLFKLASGVVADIPALQMAPCTGHHCFPGGEEQLAEEVSTGAGLAIHLRSELVEGVELFPQRVAPVDLWQGTYIRHVRPGARLLCAHPGCRDGGHSLA